MSTKNKDGSKKISSTSKEKTSSRTSLSKKESITDRTDTKKKKESQKTKTKETTLSGLLSKISEEDGKLKKASISTKTSSKPDKTPTISSTQISKSEKDVSTPSTRVSSKQTSSKPDKTPTSSSTKISKSEKDVSTPSTRVSSKQTSSKPDKTPTSSSTKISKSEKEVSTPSTRLSSKQTSSKPDKAPTSSSTKISKSEKEVSTPSTRVSSKQEKISSTTSKKVSKSEKESSNTPSKSSSRRSHDITKSTNVATSKKVSGNREVPSTPSSSRVTKTQYFPSKNLYSNALKYSDVPEDIRSSVKEEQKSSKKTSSKERGKNTSSKVIRPDPIDSSRSVRSIRNDLKESSFKNFSPDTGRKSVRSLKESTKNIFTREPSPDTSSISERPKTATLRKGSIVNANIVGPEAYKNNKKTLIKEQLTVKENALPVKKKTPSPRNSEDDYEDDFESYGSDFETYSSSEDNTNLAKISGEETSSVSSSSEDVPEQTDLSPTILPRTDNKKLSFSVIDDEKTHDSGTFELSDYKHKRILEHIKESPDKKNSSVLQDIKLKEHTNLASLSDEGFEDHKSLQFINFADARKKCEQRKANQLRKKRGEDILSMIKLDNVNYTIFDLPAIPYEVFISSYGQHNTAQASAQTGDDDVSEEVQTEAIEVQAKWIQMPIKFSSFDQQQENFWNNYKQEYLGVGDDNVPEDSLNKVDFINEKRLGSFFTRAADLLFDILAEANIANLDKINKNERDLPFSKGYVQFNTKKDIFENCRVQNISVFSKNINHILTVHIKTEDSDDCIKSVVSVWDVSDFNAPRAILVSYGEICCATFSSGTSEYIFAGQKDGAVVVWNIKEKNKIYGIQSTMPSFTTDIGSSHFAKVVSIQLIEDKQDQKDYFDIPENNELCSLDEEGEIIIWNLYTDSESNFESNKSLSNLVLINTGSISLQNVYPELPDLLCTEFLLLDKYIYVSTNYGFVLHCILNVHGRSVKKFVPATTIDATCLEACPFSSSLFLAGYLNGDITLYSTTTERPLMVLRNNEEITNTSVETIQWSKTKPFVLYAKDSKNTVHIWDLSKSDMYPEYSIPFKERISCLKLSPVIDIEQPETSYMLIGTEDGKVYLHLLNKEYGQESYEIYKEDVATFSNYVSRL